jgi:hypothetical protein
MLDLKREGLARMLALSIFIFILHHTTFNVFLKKAQKTAPESNYLRVIKKSEHEYFISKNLFFSLFYT